MKLKVAANVALLGLSILRLSAQESKAKVAPTGPYPYMGQSAKLTPVEQQGQRIFQQRCPLCHTLQDVAIRQPGPRIMKDINENVARKFIMDGSPGKMPGFKYGLSAAEITAVIAYIRTGLATPSIDQVGPLQGGRGGRGGQPATDN